MSKKYKLNSMTGFGRSALVSPYGQFEVEISGVNRRYLEIHLHLPKSLTRFEVPLKEILSTNLGRGQVMLSLNLKLTGKEPIDVTPNLLLAKALKEAYEKIAKELNLPNQITLDLLSQEGSLLLYNETPQEDATLLKLLKEVVSNALAEFKEMRGKEGEVLALDFAKRVAVLEGLINEIESKSKESSEKYREKLLSRVKELTQSDDERILKEIALFAEKVDVTEEIVRFKNHLSSFAETVDQTPQNLTDTKGKRLEFLLQELFREINTIGAKTTLGSVSTHVVDAKCELEKMREQVQNIE